MEKLILTDIDGVCLDWNTGFDEIMIEHGYTRVPDSDQHYNLRYRYNASIADIHHMVTLVNNSDRMRTLKPQKGAVKYINRLVDHGFRFIAITSMSDSCDAKKYRTENLMNVFGDVFDDVICLPSGSSKDTVLDKWEGSGLFWIDDHFTHAEAGYEAGLRTILVSTTYNQHFQTDLFPRTSIANHWRDIYTMICKEYNISNNW